MKSLLKQKISKFIDKISKIKSFPYTFSKFFLVSVLLFSSINILPLIPEFNNTKSDTVNAAGACDPTASGLPQWATSGYSFTRERYKSCVTSPSKSVNRSWKFSQGDVIGNIVFNTFQNPFIGNDGTVYVIGVANTSIRYLLAIKPDKTLKWSNPYQLIGKDYITPRFQVCNGAVRMDVTFEIIGITPNGDIVVGGDAKGCYLQGQNYPTVDVFYVEKIKDNGANGVHSTGIALRGFGNDTNTEYDGDGSPSPPTLSPDGSYIAISHYGNPDNPFSYLFYDLRYDLINLPGNSIPKGASPNQTYYAQPCNAIYTASYPTPLTFRFITNANAELQSGGSNKYSADTLNGDATNNQAFSYYGEGDPGSYSYVKGVRTFNCGDPSPYSRDFGLWDWITRGDVGGNAHQGCSNNQITTYVPSWGRTAVIYSGRIHANSCQSATIKVTNLDNTFTYNGVTHVNNRNETQFTQNEFIIGVDKSDPTNPKLLVLNVNGANQDYIARYNMTNTANGQALDIGSWPQSGTFTPTDANYQFNDYVIAKGVLYYAKYIVNSQIQIGALDLNNNLAPLSGWDINQATFPSTIGKAKFALADDGSIYLTIGTSLIKFGSGSTPVPTGTIKAGTTSNAFTMPLNATVNINATVADADGNLGGNPAVNNDAGRIYQWKDAANNANTFDYKTQAAGWNQMVNSQCTTDRATCNLVLPFTPNKTGTYLFVINGYDALGNQCSGNYLYTAFSLDPGQWERCIATNRLDGGAPTNPPPNNTGYNNKGDYIVITVVDTPPVGRIQPNNCTTLSGYAYDTDNLSYPVRLDIYIGGSLAQRDLLANSGPAGNPVAGNHNFVWPIPGTYKDGTNKTVRMHIYSIDFLGNKTNLGNDVDVNMNPSFFNCQPDPWFIVGDAQSYSLSGFNGTVNSTIFSNPENAPPSTVTDVFSNASVFVKNPVQAVIPSRGFYGSADGVSNITSYKDNGIKNYIDTNSLNSNKIFKSTTYKSLYPKGGNYTEVKTSGTNILGFDTTRVNTLTINLSSILPNKTYIYNENNDVTINYDLNNNPTKPSGVALFLFNVKSVTVKVPNSLFNNSGTGSIIVLTDSDITVLGEHTQLGNNNNNKYQGTDYLNMGLISGKSQNSNGGNLGGDIIYKCNGYDPNINVDASGCRIEQNGFSYAENKVSINYKNTADLKNDASGPSDVKNQPTLKIKYNPTFLNDFTKQLSFYDFTTDFLGFNF